MLLFQIWPLLNALLLIFLGWQLFRFVRLRFRKLQLRTKTTKLQLYQEMEVREAERSRIANDLHDDLGNLIYAASMRTNCVRLATTEDQQHLVTARQYLAEAIERLSIIVHDLSPLVLSNKGLDTALQEFFARCNGVVDADLEYVYKVKSSIPVNTGLQLYRIVQEIVQNGLKYSLASQIQVCLFERKGTISLLYVDNGIGFDKEKAGDALGLGLKSIMTRIEMLGGEMTLNTQTGKGVEYSFEIPL